MSTSVVGDAEQDGGTDRDEYVPLLGNMTELASSRQLSGDTSVRPFANLPDTVQFCMPIFVAYETDGKIELRIMRVGNGTSDDQAVKVSYRTEEGSAKAGVQYEHVSGVAEMPPGQSEAAITVPIKETRLWHPTLEFKVILSDPVMCTLGGSLKQARVKVIDENTFPDDSFQNNVSSGVESRATVNGLRLYLCFTRYLLAQDGIPWRTMVMICIDLLKNVYHFVMMMTTVYWVDYIFNLDRPPSELVIPGNRLYSAYVISVLTVAPMFLFFVLDHIVVRLDVKGLTRSLMTRNLFRKFMNYSQESTDRIPRANMVSTIVHGASEVTTSYLKFIDMMRLLVEIGLSLTFTLRYNREVWCAAVAVPIVMAMWCVICTKVFLAASTSMCDKEDVCVWYINEVFEKIRLVVAYGQRYQMNDIFVAKDEELRHAKRTERVVSLTSTFIPKVVGPASVAAYIAIGAALVLQKRLDLGVFLATIRVLTSVCSAFNDFFELTMGVLGTVPTLKTMFLVLNMPTDVPEIGRSNGDRMNISAEKQEKLPADGAVPKMDRLAIEVTNVDFAFSSGGTLLFKNINFVCAQGQLCHVSSGAGNGRHTLMQMLSHRIFPTAGSLFVPSHLRVVHITQEIVLMRLSAWENLNFGAYGASRAGNNPYRVQSILRFFSMVNVEKMCRHELDKLKGVIEGEHGPEDGNFSIEAFGTNLELEKLREGELGELHIARAFIMNPEVLVMHRPFSHYRPGRAWEKLKSALITHRDNRGLCMPPETSSQRRPRTVFYTSDTKWQSAMADWNWELPAAVGGVCKQYATTAKLSSSTEPRAAYTSTKEDGRQPASPRTSMTQTQTSAFGNMLGPDIRSPRHPERSSVYDPSSQTAAFGNNLGQDIPSPRLSGRSNLYDDIGNGPGGQPQGFSHPFDADVSPRFSARANGFIERELSPHTESLRAIYGPNIPQLSISGRSSGFAGNGPGIPPQGFTTMSGTTSPRSPRSPHSSSREPFSSSREPYTMAEKAERVDEIKKELMQAANLSGRALPDSFDDLIGLDSRERSKQSSNASRPFLSEPPTQTGLLKWDI